jgi:hypothetical protein
MTVSLKIRAALGTDKVASHKKVSPDYTPLGGPIESLVSTVMIITSFNKSICLSLDGEKDMLVISRVNSPVTIDISLNREFFPIGTQFYLKQGPEGPPTNGDIAIYII